MAYWDDLITPAELTGFVREVPTPANYTLNQFLPDVAVRDIEAVTRKLTKTNRAAKFRSYDAETPIGKRDKVDETRVALPPLGQKTVVGEEERIRLEQARLGGDGSAAMIEAIYDDAAINTTSVLSSAVQPNATSFSDACTRPGSSNGVAAANCLSVSRWALAWSAEPSIVVNAIWACCMSDAILRPIPPPATARAPTPANALAAILPAPANAPPRRDVMPSVCWRTARSNPSKLGLTSMCSMVGPAHSQPDGADPRQVKTYSPRRPRGGRGSREYRPNSTESDRAIPAGQPPLPAFGQVSDPGRI